MSCCVPSLHLPGAQQATCLVGVLHCIGTNHAIDQQQGDWRFAAAGGDEAQSAWLMSPEVSVEEVKSSWEAVGRLYDRAVEGVR